MSRRWGVIRADWNGAERAQGHKVHRLEYYWIRVQDIWNRKVPEEGNGIRIASLNIRSGWTGGLEAALCALKKCNVNIGVLQ